MTRSAATDQVGRILSLVPWIAAHDGPSIDEVCAHFDITRDQLHDDLNAVMVVGLAPYTPGDLVEVLYDADEFDDAEHVSIGFTNFFERPLRLTLHEALALLAAGAAARHQPGHDPVGPLARGLDKVASVVGVDPDSDLDVRVSQRQAELHAQLTEAVEHLRVVRMTYHSYARDAITQRDIEPRRVLTVDGATYVAAWCRRSTGARRFRLDRITDLTVTDETFTARDDDEDVDDVAFDPDADLPRVTIDLSASDRWVTEGYPVIDVAESGDRLRVTLAVAATPWLERLLLRLGPDARVVDGPPELRTAGRDAARRILDRLDR